MAVQLPESSAPPRVDPWAAWSQAGTAQQMCQAWLEVLCTALLAPRAGLLLLAQPDGAFAPVASHPPARELGHLREIATEALRSRETAVHEADGQVRVAAPLLAGDTLQGAVVLELGRVPPAEIQRALHLIAWGGGWLAGLHHQRELARGQHQLRKGGFLVDTLLGLLAERTPREAGLALVNRLGREFDSPQVHLALAHGATLRLLALSHAAWFEEKAGVPRLALQAMHEAFDQRRAVGWPAAEGDSAAGPVNAAHRRYAEEAGVAHAWSVPLRHDGRIAGVLMLERDRAFSAEECAYLERLAIGLAPALMLQREAHQGALPRAWRTTRRALAAVWGPRYPAAKLGAAVAAGVLLLLGTVPAPFRIGAQAVVEGSVQRAVVAPFEGFLREAPVRAGDVVRQGQVLATLEDRDLRLERVRWESELEVALRKEREAMASGNAVDQRLAGAQASQARAQLDLAVHKLDRATVVAPFDGTVVKGDLSQQIGSPVEQGKMLFELAPLDAWRVILKVDERDIAHVHAGARGELVLASVPGRAWPFTVRKVTPVSVAADGRNHFRVEAELAQGAPQLSPNMEGVGKVAAGHASLLWQWTRPLAEWLRLAWWRMVP